MVLYEQNQCALALVEAKSSLITMVQTQEGGVGGKGAQFWVSISE